MKKIALLLLLFSGIVHGQVVNFNDSNFKAYLLACDAINGNAHDLAQNPFAIDSNADGEIQVTEALQVSSLFISANTIIDLTGLEAFTNLQRLTLFDLNNLVAPAPLSTLSLVDTIEIQNTSLTSIDFTGMNTLGIARINNNTQLSGMIVSDLADTLVTLECNSNQLQTLDVSNFPLLQTLYCQNNALTSLNVQNCPVLTKVTCYQNQLTSVDLSGLGNLVRAEVMNPSAPASDWQITSIDLSDCPLLNNPQVYHSPNLTTVDFTNCSQLLTVSISNSTLAWLSVAGCSALLNLNVGRSSFTSIDLSSCLDLYALSLQFNQLAAMDLSGYSNLFSLDLSHGTLTSVNLSGCTTLNDVNLTDNPLLPTLDLNSCVNLNQLIILNGNFTSLFLKNGRDETIAFSGNANLQYVCADDSQFVTLQQQFLSVLPNVVINSYCSFVPGGNFNTITGTLPFDSLGDGCDAGDFSNPYLILNISDGTNAATALTNTNGNYSFYTQNGNFTVTPVLENPAYFSFSPPSAVVNFPTVNNSVQTETFCLSANGVHPDLEVVLVPIDSPRPGFDTRYQIIYRNKGNQLQSGSVDLTFDDAHTDLVTATPAVDLQAVNQLRWDFVNLLPLETRKIAFTLNVNTPLETPPVNMGDILDSNVTITGSGSDETPLDNTFDCHHIVVNSHDPNNKSCLEGTSISAEEIGKYIHYNINFENIGTDEAVNVVVKDVIDFHKLDMSSLQPQFTSHDVEVKVRDSVVEFVFRHIHLAPSGGPIGGHGNVLFKIKTLPDLHVGDQIANTANIFFDYNAPVDTNVARTLVSTMEKDNFIKDESIRVVPNPAQHFFRVTAENTIRTVELFDALGRLLQTAIENKKSVEFNISDRASGVYFLKINTEKGTSVMKIIKE